MSTNYTLQRICAWSGIAVLACFTVMFMLIAGLIPPMSPTLGPEQVTQHLIDNKLSIRLGIALTMAFSILVVPFNAALVLRLRRAEGNRTGVLTISQLMCAAVFYPLGFVCPLMVMAAAVFRPESRPPAINLALTDLFWLFFVGVIGYLSLQGVVIAVAVFVDKSHTPTFPRWFAYFNVWYAVLAVPGGAVVPFNSGPLAWNGILAFWLPVVAFFAWYVTLSILMVRSINQEQLEAESTARLDAEGGLDAK